MSNINILWPLVVIWSIITIVPAAGALQLDSVNPDSGKMGEGLEVTLTGSDFDLNTRVSLSLDTMNRGLQVGSLDLSGVRAEKLALEGNRAYVADMSILQIVDLADPAAPSFLGEMDTGTQIYGIDATGSMVFIRNGDGLLIIDVSVPADPVLLSSLDLSIMGWTGAVKVAGNHLYVCGDGLQIVDISDPADPFLVSSVDAGIESRDLAIRGDWAYFIYYRNLHSSDAHSMNDICGLRIVDISDPANPSPRGVVEQGYTSGWQSLDVSDNLAVVGEGNMGGGCYVINLNDLLSPTMVGTITENEVADVLLSHTTAYVRMLFDGQIQIFDLSDPQSPQQVGSIDTASTISTPSSLALTEDLLVSLTYAYPSGLKVYDVSRARFPSTLGRLSDIPYTDEIVVQDSLAYLANSRGLLVIDVSWPSHPAAIGSIDTVDGGDKSIVVKDGIAYLADTNGLHIIDVSIPSSPVLLSTLGMAGQGAGIALSGNRLYMTGGQSGLQIIDVTDPAAPALINSLPLQGLTDRVAVSGSTVYVTAGCLSIPPGPELYRSLQIIDVSDPAAAQMVGSLELVSCPNDLVVSEGLAYVADAGISVIDVSDPTQPNLVASLATESFRTLDIALSGQNLYGAFWGEGLQAIDLQDPARPVTVGEVEGLGSVARVAVAGELAYVADESGFSVTVLPLPVELGDISVDSASSITVILPEPPVAGFYNVRVFNNNDSDILLGGVFFSEDTPPVPNLDPIVGDWDGDGSVNPGFFDDGIFSLDMDNDGQFDSMVAFGQADDRPVVGDWDGDGRDDLGVFRPAETMFYLDVDSDGVADIMVGMGRTSDLPLAGDWDGDGTDDIGLFRSSTRQYFMDFDEDGITDRDGTIGSKDDLPLVGDWDGDGIDSIGVYRPDIGRFYLDDDGDGLHDHALSYGSRTDIPLTGEWNGDGITDVGFFRPGENGFYLDHDFDAVTDEVILYSAE